LNFTSDNGSGADPRILAALAEANRGPAAAYGADPWSRAAEKKLGQVFETDLAAFLVATGTASNALALAALTRPFEAVFCHEEAHVQDDECGAPEFFTHGAKLVGIPGTGGKITPDGLTEALARHPRAVSKTVQPAALTLSQVTEAGTIYTLDEIAALAKIAHEAGVAVHMDGARFANALVALDANPADMSWRAGVDVLSLGATKNGAFACEAVIFFDPRRAETFPYLRKRGGHTVSKGRWLGAQMGAWLEGGLWLDLARHANAAAQRLSQGLAALPDVRLVWPTQANEVFGAAPAARVAAWAEAGAAFYPWTTRSAPPETAAREGETMFRLVTSFETSAEEIDAFLALAQSR
jgi:threonine aldolase